MRILLKKLIYKFFNYPIDIFFLFKDLLFFKLLKKNSYRSYNMMLRLFFITGGFSNDIINFFVSKKAEEKKMKFGIFSRFSENEILNYKKNLENNGYLVIENILSSEEVKILVEDFVKLEGYYACDNDIKKKEIINLNNPVSVMFNYDSNDIIKNINFQKILFDSSIINFSQLYLNSYPVIDNVSAWWSFPSSQPDKNAAQWWHFDLDRPKWLKFFFFLTDCSIENGAHSFVRGSHKNNGIPWSLRKKGYERLDDNDVEKKFPKKDIIDILATKGSLLIEDTRGLHKGRHLIKNNRFLIQVQYSSTLFGGAVKNFVTPKLNNHMKEVINEYEYTYSLFK